jgi:drug/metabolite transporter (DMT)-like permease
MVLCTLFWSSAGVVTRQMQSASRFEMVFWRSAFAALFVLVVLIATKRSPVRAVVQARGLALLSAAMWATMFTAFMLALTFTSTANALVVSSVGPLFTALLARIFLREALPRSTWIAIAASIGGLVWMFGAGVTQRGERDVLGMGIALLVPLAGAVNLIALRSNSQNLDLIPSVMLGAALSALIAFPMIPLWGASARDIGFLAFLGVFQLGVPCMLLVLASRTLLAPEIALLALLEAVLGPLWAWLGANEIPSSSTLWGGAVVLGALALNEVASFRVRQGKP